MLLHAGRLAVGHRVSGDQPPTDRPRESAGDDACDVPNRFRAQWARGPILARVTAALRQPDPFAI